MVDCKVVIRADGSGEMGLGHIMRCLSLARAIKEELGERYREGMIRFVSRDDQGARNAVAGSEFEEDFRWIPWDGDDIEAFREVLHQLDPRIVVTDIRLDGRVQEYLAIICPRSLHVSLQEHNYPLLDGDIIVAPTVRPMAVAKQGARDISHFTGPDYLLLPPEIAERRKSAPDPGDSVKTVTVSMGGGDPRRHTLAVLKAIRAYNNPGIEWRVVLGPASDYDREELARDFPLRIEYVVGSEIGRTGFFDLLEASDAVITNGATTLYEALALGRPCMAIPQGDFEAEVVRLLEKAGACIGADGSSAVKVLEVMSRFLEDSPLRKAIAETGGNMIDGEGCRRVARLIAAHL